MVNVTFLFFLGVKDLPLLGFTKLKGKLLDGTKTQTIRRPRKRPFKVGDKLYIYWKLRTKQCEKLGEAIVTKVVRKAFYKLNKKDAILDGFNNLDELIIALEKMHKPCHDALFDIITFRWTKKRGKPTHLTPSPPFFGV